MPDTSIVNTSRIAIVGLGQLGVSLAMRLKEIGCRELLAVARRPESLEQAIERGWIDAGSTAAADVLPVVDIVFLCVPLSVTIEFVETNLEHFRFGGLVTDVGSVKGSIVQALRPKLLERGACFIGSHPMAGSERSGADAARIDLYRDAIVFLTPTEDDEPEALTLLREFWRAIGACPIELPADRHDLACAHSSHALHVVAGSVVRSVLGQGDVEANTTATAGGFRDTTRIAASGAAMWTDICRHNRAAVLQALTAFESDLASIRAAIEEGDWEAVAAFFTNAKELRDVWFDQHAAARGYRK